MLGPLISHPCVYGLVRVDAANYPVTAKCGSRLDTEVVGRSLSRGGNKQSVDMQLFRGHSGGRKVWSFRGRSGTS